MGPAQQELRDALNALNLEVDQSIVESIREKANAALDEARSEEPIKVGELEVRPGMTLIVTMPASAPSEMIQRAAESMKRNFPDNAVVFKTEGWDVDVSSDGS